MEGAEDRLGAKYIFIPQLMTTLIVLRTPGGAGERERQRQVRFHLSQENQIKIMNDTPGMLRFPGGANECPWS